jgi:tripartite-type tricarboxylate transporter receptor subunit TctC
VTLRRRDVLRAVPAVAAWPAVRAQDGYPNKPITLVVPFAPGGIADLTARTVAEAMGRALGQPFVIDNKPSAGSIVASTAVAKAPSDGYTLLLMSNANAVSTGLFKKLPYDPVKDFVPISTFGYFDLGVFAASGSKFATLKDAVAFAKANPGKLNVGTINVGSTQHLAAKWFEQRAGVDTLVVPYKGTPAVLTALRAGEVDLAFEILGPMLAQVNANAVKALAVTSEQRFAALPAVPTAVESGVAGYTVASWNALAAPAGTPPAVLERLNRSAREAIARPEVSRKLQELGVRAQASTPEQMAMLLAGEIKRWGDVIRAAKIEPE